MDFFNLNTMNHIKKGDLLARLTPEDPGENGCTVTNEYVKPREVKRLIIKTGRNISMSEDKLEAYSEVDGHVTLTEDKIFVSDIYNVENVDNPIRKFEPHICRHTFATNMQYLPPKTLQYILGHGNISTTMDNYVDAKPSDEQLTQINAIAHQLMAI